MVNYKILFTKQAQKDAKKITASGLRAEAEKLLQILEKDPYQTPPLFKSLVGDLSGLYSRRINIQHKLVYQVCEEKKPSKYFAYGPIRSKNQ